MPSIIDQDLPYPDRFHLAAKFIDQRYGDLEQNQELPNETKLILYALRQQAEQGQCKEPAPYMWNVTARYKHSAWSGLGQMIKPEAMVHYVRQVEKLEPSWVEFMKNHGSPSLLQVSDEVKNANEQNGASVIINKDKRPLQLTPPDSPTRKASLKDDNHNIKNKYEEAETKYRDGGVGEDEQEEEFEIQSTSTSRERARERKKSKKSTSHHHHHSSSASNIPDFSTISDSQILSIVSCAERSKNNTSLLLMDESIVKGLVHEIQRLRRTLVMSHALPSSFGNDDNNEEIIDDEDDDGNHQLILSSNAELNQPQVPLGTMMMMMSASTTPHVKTSPKVQHQYYGEKRSVPAATSSASSSSSSAHQKAMTKTATSNQISVTVKTSTQEEAQHVENQNENDDKRTQSKEQEQDQNEEKPKRGWFTWLTG